MFTVGDMAVYPAQGVGVIEAIETKEFAGQRSDFYVLRICDSDMTIMVPTANAEHVGLRTLIDKDHVDRVYALLRDDDTAPPSVTSWSRRQRDYSEKIKSGDLLEVAGVLRELYRIKADKELSYGEKKVLELARRLVVKEVACAEGVDEEQVDTRLAQVLS